MKYPTFDDWFYEQEGFALRAERAYEVVAPGRAEELKVWLQAAFDAARLTVQPTAFPHECICPTCGIRHGGGPNDGTF